MKKKCPHYKICQNGADGCYYTSEKPEECIRYLPTKGTNLYQMDGTFEVQPNINIQQFSQIILNFIESQGWVGYITMKPYTE